MALLKTFAIYDQTAKSHLPPFVLPNQDMAIRTFSDCVNKEGHDFNRHPSHYTLVCLGDYDEDSGILEPLPVPVLVGTGTQYIESVNSADIPT